jgi:hypothetical protein
VLRYNVAGGGGFNEARLRALEDEIAHEILQIAR